MMKKLFTIQVIGANRGKSERGFTRDEKEEQYSNSAPRDNELDWRLDLKKIDKDDVQVQISFDLDIIQ